MSSDATPAGRIGRPARTAGRLRDGLSARTLLLGAEEDAAWVRPTLIGLLAVTAVLYLWALDASGWANGYYAGAVQAATQSWKAFFFGSFDSSNYITIDKTPASLWPMALSARVFGLNSWSLLVPQALMGVATVGLVYAAVRRWFGPAGGLLAGAIVATTPVAALMFRYNNPDALLTLLLTAAAYATLRAVEDGRTRWLLLAGGLVGFGFLTKMLQAFIVLPAFALTYFVAGPPRLVRRIGQLVLAGVAVLVAGGWWVAIMELMPASARPYIGGSTTNSILELTFGYNGFGRLTGNETGAVGPGGAGPGGMFSAQAGWSRLFDSEMGGQISWLLPAALLALAAGFWLSRREPRTGMLRAGMILWGGWLLTTGAVVSLGEGIIHPYYTVALAPAVGALIGIVVPQIWARRRSLFWRALLASGVLVTAVWSFVLLDRTPDWLPALRWIILTAGASGALGLLFARSGHSVEGRGNRTTGPGRRIIVVIVAGVSLAAVLAGPVAYTLATIAQPHSGSLPTAGPAEAAFAAGGPGGPGGQGGSPGGLPARDGADGPLPDDGANRMASPDDGASGTPPNTGGLDGQAGNMGAPDGQGSGFGVGGPPPGGPGGGPPGGPGADVEVDDELAALLEEAATTHTWAAAMTSASNAAPYQIASNSPILAFGGFNGTDQSLTLEEFQQYVADGEIGYYIAGGGFAGSPNQAASARIAQWVAQTFDAQTIGGVTVYELDAPSSA